MILEYSHLQKTSCAQLLLLGLWLAYGRMWLDPASTSLVALAMTLILARNTATWRRRQKRVHSLSQSHAFAEPVSELCRRTQEAPSHVYLGRGFVWENRHVQGYHDLLLRSGLQQYIDLETPDGGYEFLHSLHHKTDHKITVPKNQLQHTLVAGTTGSGKTKFFEFLISQVCPHEPTIIIDPKGDKALLDGVFEACADHGIEDRFVFFSLAHPSNSVGFNPIANYGGPSDVADRIASIMPAGSGDQAFKNFAWQVIEVVSSALMGVQEDITLDKLQRYSMENMEELVSMGQKKLPQLPRDIRAYAEKSLERLRQQANHPREHHQKMITSLGPVLTSLNTGDIGPLLNAPPEQSLGWRDVYQNNKVVYFDLSSMLRQEVSNNVGKMIVQDLLYFVGEMYAFENPDKAMNLFVDEFYSVMFSGYIDLLNKSRGAGLRMFLGMQTTADIANALGNGQESYVRQVLGNINNKIYLRVPEKNLAQEFCDLFGTTYIRHFETMRSESSKAASPRELFGSNYARREKKLEVEKVSPDMLMHLPVGQAFVFMQARDPYKLRLPLITRAQEQKRHFSKRLMHTQPDGLHITEASPWAELDESRVTWPVRRKNI